MSVGAPVPGEPVVYLPGPGGHLHGPRSHARCALSPLSLSPSLSLSPLSLSFSLLVLFSCSLIALSLLCITLTHWIKSGETFIACVF